MIFSVQLQMVYYLNVGPLGAALTGTLTSSRNAALSVMKTFDQADIRLGNMENILWAMDTVYCVLLFLARYSILF